MTDIRVGDKVRLTREGVVTGFGAEYGIYIDGTWVRRDHHDIELLERAKLKAGDWGNRTAFDDAPIGTLLWCADFKEYRLKAKGGWYDPSSGRSGVTLGLTVEYQVLYIPE